MSGLPAAKPATSMSTAPVIETDHLRLVPLGLADAAALVHGHRPPGARWAPGYPTDLTLVVAGLVVTEEGQEGHALGPFRGYQMVRREDGMVIGDCGFLGPPDEHGTVHVGFAVAEAVAAYRLAGEALRAVIEWTVEQPEVTRVLADAAPTNIATLRVLEQAGMRRLRQDGDLVVFEA